jgi:citrate lyase beta subunit
VRHFPQLDADAVGALFHIPPAEFTNRASADLLASALGATLYLPAVRQALAGDIAGCHASGAMSMICCLEDAIRDDEVAAAEQHLVEQLRRFAAGGDGGARRTGVAAGGGPRDGTGGPLLFVRVRTADQIYRIADGLGPALGVLTGFVLPKFTADDDSLAGLKAVREVGAATAGPLYAMPILESREVANAETRTGALLAVRDLLDTYRDRVLAVRVGATDLSGLFGLRRPIDLTVWEIGVVASALTDIINVFGRADGTGFVVVGPVWEYFNRDRSRDGLIREARLDLANGMLGKTVIHPSHQAAVHAVSVVGHEEYLDATAICADPAAGGGVIRSEYRNKMNELRPHLAWARRTLRRAEIFGVAKPGTGASDLLAALPGGVA